MSFVGKHPTEYYTVHPNISTSDIRNKKAWKDRLLWLGSMLMSRCYVTMVRLLFYHEVNQFSRSKKRDNVETKRWLKTSDTELGAPENPQGLLSTWKSKSHCLRASHATLQLTMWLAFSFILHKITEEASKIKISISCDHIWRIFHNDWWAKMEQMWES